MNIAALLMNAATTFASRPAVSIGTELHLTYKDLAVRVSRLAGALIDTFRLSPGDRVALAMTNSAEYVEVLNAVWFAGLTAVPINSKLHEREFAYILNNSGARLCFATPDLAQTLSRLVQEVPLLEQVVASGGEDYRRLLMTGPLAMRDVPADAVAWLFYTSGTTGRPKGAVLSHRNLLAMTLSYFADVDTIGPQDCIIHAAPMSHGSGLYGIPHLAKAANQVIPVSGGFNPSECADLIKAYRGVSFFFAPTMINRLISHSAVNIEVDHLKTLIYGGAPMYGEDVRRALDVFGPRLSQIYGQGECPMTITGLSKDMHADVGHPRYAERLASVGIPRTGVEVAVVNPAGEQLRAGETGEITVRGDVVMSGYWNDSEATREALRDGWLHTGDLGVFDDDGFLTLKGRSRELIISGGSNIYPREVEEVLLRHPAVQEVAVIGRPNRDWGEEVVAVIVTNRPTEEIQQELDRFCCANIARFKRPRAYYFMDSLPKNNYGKVLKTHLQERFAAPAGG